MLDYPVKEDKITKVILGRFDLVILEVVVSQKCLLIFLFHLKCQSTMLEQGKPHSP